MFIAHILFAKLYVSNLFSPFFKKRKLKLRDTKFFLFNMRTQLLKIYHLPETVLGPGDTKITKM